MYKPYYSDYARFMMRFYSRNLGKKHFKNEEEKLNWYSCHKILQCYTDRDRNILVYVYGEFDTIADNVYAMANKYHIHQSIIWDMMRDFERKVADERGLLV